MTDGEKTLTFKYDAEGKRIYKKVNGVSCRYDYEGGRVVRMKRGSDDLHIDYDMIGASCIRYNGEDYYYIRNAQGDIDGIADENGDVMVGYRYDAWGRPLSVTGPMASTLGYVNPLRYRGYVYDEETGL